VPTSLPPSRVPESSNRSLGADAWAGIAVIVAMFILGVIYWSGHVNDANATGAPPSQAVGSSAAKTVIKSSRTPIQ